MIVSRETDFVEMVKGWRKCDQFPTMRQTHTHRKRAGEKSCFKVFVISTSVSAGHGDMPCNPRT